MGTRSRVARSSVALLFIAGSVIAAFFIAETGATAGGSSTLARRPRAPMKVFALVGDLVCDPSNPKYNHGTGRDNECRHLAVYRLIDSRNDDRLFRPDRFIPLGDTQYDKGVYNKYFAPGAYDDTFGRIKKITSPTVGNHEYKTSGASGYFDYFNGRGDRHGPAGERGKGYYADRSGCFSRDGRRVCTWRILFLNTELGGDKWADQLTWINRQMQNYREPCLLAVGHAGLFSTSDHYEGTSGTTGQVMRPIWDALYKGSSESLPARKNADLYITGHSHSYERFKPQNDSVKTVKVSVPTKGQVSHWRAEVDTNNGITHLVVGTGGESTDHEEPHPPADPNQVKRNLNIYGLLKLNLGLKADRSAWAAKFYKIGSKPGSTPYDQADRDCN